MELKCDDVVMTKTGKFFVLWFPSFAPQNGLWYAKPVNPTIWEQILMHFAKHKVVPIYQKDVISVLRPVFKYRG